MNTRETSNQGVAVILFELVKIGVIDNTGNDFVHIVRLTQIGADDAVELLRVVARWLDLCRGERLSALIVQAGN